MEEPKITHIHLFSDSTGETLMHLTKAVLSQFPGPKTKEHLYPFTTSKLQIDAVFENIEKLKGVVMYTILKQDLAHYIDEKCRALGIQCIPALSDIINVFAHEFNQPITEMVGRQHNLTEEYYKRIDAMNFTMSYDDGKNTHHLDEADIILVGVSRTSKTPTSVYLSHKGFKTANIPFVSEELIPEELYQLKKALIVGLTISPESLSSIRHSRLNTLNENAFSSSYCDLEHVREEIKSANRVFQRLACPVVDVTKRSVEETAARIVKLYNMKMESGAVKE